MDMSHKNPFKKEGAHKNGVLLSWGQNRKGADFAMTATQWHASRI